MIPRHRRLFCRGKKHTGDNNRAVTTTPAINLSLVPAIVTCDKNCWTNITRATPSNEHFGKNHSINVHILQPISFQNNTEKRSASKIYSFIAGGYPLHSNMYNVYSYIRIFVKIRNGSNRLFRAMKETDL
jgi:hypothetical protein